VNAWTWLLQRISAFILLIVLGLHILFLHFFKSGEVLTYNDITIRLGKTVFISMDIILLLFGLYHALYGLYSVFSDFNSEFRTKVVLLVVCIGAGMTFLGFGIYGFLFFMI